jgi:hypothetical protein
LTRLLFAPLAFRDIERLAAFLLESDPLAADAATELLV